MRMRATFRGLACQKCIMHQAPSQSKRATVTLCTVSHFGTCYCAKKRVDSRVEVVMSMTREGGREVRRVPESRIILAMGHAGHLFH